MAKDTKPVTFEVDEASDVPLWVQLRNRLAHLIEVGYFRAGDQLPTVRALASDININYNTVNKAYLALKSEGYLESAPGRGAFVRNLSVEVDAEASAAVDALLDECVAGCRDLGLSLDDISKCMDAKIKQTKVAEGLEAPAPGRIVTVTIGPAQKAVNH